MIIRQICCKRLRDVINIAYYAYFVNSFIALIAFIFYKAMQILKKTANKSSFNNGNNAIFGKP